MKAVTGQDEILRLARKIKQKRKVQRRLVKERWQERALRLTEQRPKLVVGNHEFVPCRFSRHSLNE